MFNIRSQHNSLFLSSVTSKYFLTTLELLKTEFIYTVCFLFFFFNTYIEAFNRQPLLARIQFHSHLTFTSKIYTQWGLFDRVTRVAVSEISALSLLNSLGGIRTRGPRVTRLASNHKHYVLSPVLFFWYLFTFSLTRWATWLYPSTSNKFINVPQYK